MYKAPVGWAATRLGKKKLFGRVGKGLNFVNTSHILHQHPRFSGICERVANGTVLGAFGILRAPKSGNAITVMGTATET